MHFLLGKNGSQLYYYISVLFILLLHLYYYIGKPDYRRVPSVHEAAVKSWRISEAEDLDAL